MHLARRTVCATFPVLLVLLGLEGCMADANGPTGSTGAPSETTGPVAPPAHACAYETRRVQHCGGASPQGPWMPYCDDGPCPGWLDDHRITFVDLDGNSCDEDSVYRNVVDVEGSCDAWKSAGEPLTHPTQLYCGESLLYNEFDRGTMQDGDCQSCLQSHCAAGYAACYPSNGAGYKPSRCNDLIRCMQNCTVDDVAGADACTQQFSDVVAAANQFLACAIRSCASTCN
jgi:hypothetical protein